MKKQLNQKFALLLIMAAALTIQVSGQDGRRPGGGPGRGRQMSEEDIKRRVDNMSENLDLTEDQHKKILNHEMEFFTKMQVEREKNAGNREAMQASMREAREARDKKYEEVLTAEQMKKWKEMQEQRRNQMQQQREQNSQGGQGERPARGRGRN